MSKQDYEKLLDTYVDELPKELTPPKDIWSGIDHAIELRASKNRWQKKNALKAAAVAAFFIGSTWFIRAEFYSNNNHFNNEVNLSMLANDIDKGFQMQKANMLATYAGQPALTSTWEDQLRELETARDDIWEALKQNPNNKYMVQILVEIQQQQLDLIKNVHTLTNRRA